MVYRSLYVVVKNIRYVIEIEINIKDIGRKYRLRHYFGLGYIVKIEIHYFGLR